MDSPNGSGEELQRQAMKISEIKVRERFRRDLGDLAGLAQSIKCMGLIHPIVVTPDAELICGERRLAAVKELGWQEVPVRILDLDDLVQAEHDENMFRKNFSPSEAAAIGKAIEEREKVKAKQRKAEGQRSGGRGNKKLGGKLPASKREVRAIAARAVGRSPRTYAKIKAVTQAAEKDAKLAPLVEEMDKTGKVDPVYRQLRMPPPKLVAPPLPGQLKLSATDAKAPPLFQLKLPHNFQGSFMSAVEVKYKPQSEEHTVACNVLNSLGDLFRKMQKKHQGSAQEMRVVQELFGSLRVVAMIL